MYLFVTVENFRILLQTFCGGKHHFLGLLLPPEAHPTLLLLTRVLALGGTEALFAGAGLGDTFVLVFSTWDQPRSAVIHKISSEILLGM